MKYEIRFLPDQVGARPVLCDPNGAVVPGQVQTVFESNLDGDDSFMVKFSADTINVNLEDRAILSWGNDEGE